MTAVPPTRCALALALLGALGCQSPAPTTALPPDIDGAVTFPDHWTLSLYAMALADLDHDGFDDMVLMATDRAAENGGGLFVVYGRRARIDGNVAIDAPDLLLREQLPPVIQTQLDTGDFDGDGIDDVLLSSYRPGPTGGWVAVVRLLYGSTTRRTGSVAMEDVAATLALPIETLGVAVARAGDLDGDGVDDMILLANLGTGFDIHIVHGSRTRRVGESLVVPDAHVLGDVRPVVGAVAAAGDVDGDGHADLLVDVVDPDVPDQIDTRLVFGPFAGDVDVPSDAPFVANMDETNRPIGDLDVDGDGLADFVVPLLDGTVEVFTGSHTRPTGTLTPEAILTPWCGITRAFAPIAGGDVDGDGREDLVLAHPACMAGGSDRVDVVFGAPTTRVLATADRTWNGRLGETVDGTTTNAGVGFGLAVGDFDGDGLDDAMFGFSDGPTFFRSAAIAYGAPR